ncbi:MAG: hypothetical protein U1D55_18085 [Phycisphaerae bacterium]
MKRFAFALACTLLAQSAWAAFTRNIMLTGYWPPTNEMVRGFSPNPTQNPGGWQGQNWQGLGFDVYSYFPEFPGGVLNQGVGDLMVDYQDTYEDFFRIANQIQPVAIITFSRTSNFTPPSWEVEWRQRNLESWIDDYIAPTQPTPSPPDPTAAAGFIRYSSLPMQQIVNAVNATPAAGANAFIDQTDFGGGFLSEFIAYMGTWYHDMHANQSDPAWNVAAGHIHVSGNLNVGRARLATEVTLRELLNYVNTQIPEPSTAAMMALLAIPLLRRRK